MKGSITLKTQAKAQRTDIENYRRLVAKLAWRAWRALPMQTRTWIGIDDMIESGMLTVFHYLHEHINPRCKHCSKLPFEHDDLKCKNGKYERKYNGLRPPGYVTERSDSIMTGLYHCLQNLYVREYIEVYGAWKRGWELSDVCGCGRKKNEHPNSKCTKFEAKKVSVRMDSLQALQERFKEDGKATMDDVVGTIPALYTTEDHIIEHTLSECFVVPALAKVYEQASPKLKDAFVDWFWYKSSKVHTKAKPFKRMAYEFRELCMKERLHCDDCLHVVRSPECLNSLSMRIFGIPYDHTCTPVIGGQPLSYLIN